MRLMAHLLIGLLFGLGLVVSGMSNPAKVVSFLDVAAIGSGTWDASLAFVMGGAVAVTFFGYRLVLERGRPVFDDTFQLLHPPARSSNACWWDQRSSASAGAWPASAPDPH